MMNIQSIDLEPDVAHIINTLRGQDCVAQLLLVQIPLHPEYPTFKLEKAVCNHGFFMMAPNKWDPATKTLTRPLRLGSDKDDSDSVVVLIRHSPVDVTLLQVLIDNTLPIVLNPPNITNILEQVKRMLRISPEDETVSAKFQMLHPQAADEGFGRLFRSPTVFEDIIKSLLLSNSGWGRSLDSAKALCELELGGMNPLKNFPIPKQLSQLDPKCLKLCKLGYRANIFSSIVDKVLSGNLPQIDPTSQHKLSVIHKLMNINGIGSFIASNVSMCIGLYQTVPIDTETFRHFRKVHSIQNPTEKTIKDMYHKFSPYDSLAYWFEHHMLYERENGKLSELAPSRYHLVTSSSNDHNKRIYKQATITLRQTKKIVKKEKKKKKKGRRDNRSRDLLLTM